MVFTGVAQMPTRTVIEDITLSLLDVGTNRYKTTVPLQSQSSSSRGYRTRFSSPLEQRPVSSTLSKRISPVPFAPLTPISTVPLQYPKDNCDLFGPLPKQGPVASTSSKQLSPMPFPPLSQASTTHRDLHYNYDRVPSFFSADGTVLVPPSPTIVTPSREDVISISSDSSDSSLELRYPGDEIKSKAASEPGDSTAPVVLDVLTPVRLVIFVNAIDPPSRLKWGVAHLQYIKAGTSPLLHISPSPYNEQEEKVFATQLKLSCSNTESNYKTLPITSAQTHVPVLAGESETTSGTTYETQEQSQQDRKRTQNGQLLDDFAPHFDELGQLLLEKEADIETNQLWQRLWMPLDLQIRMAMLKCWIQQPPAM
ncbi:hypothetical protein MSAN_00777100 [Mycena sanguinolenta]|uniref:Uncharacterized protein n=1 Tax=Mycena sanguinolenta TaxID=230812 RepID=A0A8H6Z901_9AGAR|nr:hypothetical protein MSAN_00777100 [Mycena sanguinolenta]